MTTKQAADIIRMLLGYLKGEIEPPKQETIEEARAFEQQGYECLEMAIKALEQQPCEDAVSREAVMNVLGDSINDDKDYRRAVVLLNNLLSVTPKEKSKGYIHIDDVYRLIAGHSNYHGDNILSALTCIAEGKNVIKPITPLD